MYEQISNLKISFKGAPAHLGFLVLFVCNFTKENVLNNCTSVVYILTLQHFLMCD